MITTPIIPENLAPIASILRQYLSPLLNWFSKLVYQRLQQREPEHRLLVLEQILDLSEMESACAKYHKGNGQGRPVVHAVPRLVRAMLVKYLYNYSLRQLEEAIRYHSMVKWFVGYPIFAEGPDHSTLERFELYLILNHSRLFFDTTLRQIDVAFPDERHRPQLGDTFAMHANAALETIIKRLRHTVQELLRAYLCADATAYACLWVQLDEGALFGSADEKTECYLSSDEWRQRLLRTVAASLHCLTRLRQTALASSVACWLERLEKILDDELHLVRDAQGRLTHVSLLPEKKRGSYRICSATDPDSTIRNHGPGKQAHGFNISVAATTDFIREIQADTGSRPDSAPIPELLQAQIDHHDLVPDKFIYDQAAGRGKTVHLVDQVSDGRTQLVAKPVRSRKMKMGKKKEGFTPQAFTLSQDGFSLTCPHNRISQRKYRSGSGDGDNFRFIAPQCLGCPFLSPCRGSDVPPTTPRNVFISDYRAEWDKLLAYSQTDDFKRDMRLRPQVERIIAGLVLHNGARRARFRGLQKVDFQAKMCATAYNLKRWLSLLSGKPRPTRRRFAAPAPPQGQVGLVTG